MTKDKTIYNSVPPGSERAKKLAQKLSREGFRIYDGARGEQMVAFLGQIVPEEKATSVYADIGRIMAYAASVAKKRGLSNHRLEDPLTPLRIYADLREEDKSSKIEIDKTHRPGKNPPFIATVELDTATILATVAAGAFQLKRDIEDDEPSEKDGKAVSAHLNGIKGVLRDPAVAERVIGLIRDIRTVSEINPGGAVSPAHLNVTDAAALRQAEDLRMADFLSIFGQLPGNVPGMTGIAPEAVLARLARWSGHLAEMIENPDTYSQSRKERRLEMTRKVYLPMAAEWRQRAYEAGDTNLAATLSAVKDKLKDQSLQIEDPEGYRKTYDLILERVKALAPERVREYVTDLRSAKALVLTPIADELHALLPEELQDVCIVQARIKSVASTYAEIKKNGIENFRDGIGIRTIKRIEPREHETPAQAWGREGAEINRLAWIMEKRILEVGKFTIEPGRRKNLYDKKEREAFFAKRGRKDSGFDSRQNTLLFDTYLIEDGKKKPTRIPLETQHRSERAHYDAEFGNAAAHDSYKNILKFKPANGSANSEISVRTDKNQIIKIGRGATAADFLTEYYRNSADPALAFSVAFSILRTTHYFNPAIPDPNLGFTTPLVPGDRIMILRENTELRDSPEHRREVIKACKLGKSRKLLIELDRKFLETDSRAARPGASPTSLVQITPRR